MRSGQLAVIFYILYTAYFMTTHTPTNTTLGHIFMFIVAGIVVLAAYGNDILNELKEIKRKM